MAISNAPEGALNPPRPNPLPPYEARIRRREVEAFETFGKARGPAGHRRTNIGR